MKYAGYTRSHGNSARKGGPVISTDKMTGVQALEHKYPDKPPLLGECARMEFEYIHHGTIRLIVFLMSQRAEWKHHT